jgi:pyrroline-5-carboxylate reductase
MTTILPSSLVLVGAGKMGGALLEGWIDTGLNPRTVTVLEPQPSAEMLNLAGAHKMRLNPPLNNVEPPSALVLAVKPQSLAAAAPVANRLIAAGTTVVSILAGKTIANLGAALSNARAVVRAMPNLPASIRRGITVAVANPATNAQQREIADGLLRAVGVVEWVKDEGLIDAVTALSGSGPAYVFYLVECMAHAGHVAGLPVDLAERLARVTVAGAGELLHTSDLPAAKLRHDVTSPGGTTAAALEKLMAVNGLQPIVTEAIAAAKRRAKELSG